MSKKPKPKQRSVRFKPRRFVLFGLLLAAAVGGFFALKTVRDRFGAKHYLKEARLQADKKKYSLAVGYLSTYLDLVPDDLDALELKSKILYETAGDQFQALEALKVHGQLIAGSPRDARWEQARRRMVKLNMMVRRWRAALEIAKQLKGDDAERHRLYARASAAVGVAEKDKSAIDLARQEYEAAEAKEPGDVASAEELARIYRDLQDNPARALQVLDQAVKNTGNVPKKEAAALLARARHYSAAGEFEKASADVDNAVRDDPDGVMPRLVAAEVALQRRQTDVARTHLARIGPEARKDAGAELRIKTLEGLIDLADSRSDEAIRVWREGLVEIGGNDVSLTWQLAHVLLEVGRVSDAEPLIDQYRRLVGGEEDDSKYLYLKALAVLRSNRPAEAIERLEAIRFKVPKPLEPHLLFSLGQAFETVRDTEKALDAYRQSAATSRKWAPPWKALARLQSQAHPEEARGTLREGLALNPDDAELLTAQARSLYEEQLKRDPQQRTMAEVERVLARAAKAAPASPDVALFRAELYANTQRAEDALALLKAASDMTPRSSALWLARANLLTNMGRLGEAQEVLDQAARAAGPEAVFAISRSAILARQAKLTESRKVLVDAIDRVPKEQQSLIWKTLGELDQARKSYDSAAAAFTRWAELQPRNPEPRLSLYQLALARGDEAAIPGAIDALRKVSGERSYYWRFARVQDLLRERKGEAPDEARDARRQNDAMTLIKEIQDHDPQLALGYLLEGRLAERRKNPQAAIDAYQKAMARGGTQEALGSLVALLSAEKRDKELQDLARAYPSAATAISQAAAVQAMKSSDVERAVNLAKQAAAGDPQGVNTRKWEIEVLNNLGKPKEAETAARAWVTEKPTEATPWIMLMMLQIKARDMTAAAQTVEQIRQHVKADRPELLLAQCYRAVGNLERAGESYREALARWPEDFNVLSGAVTFYDQTGRREEAEETLRRIRRRDPSNVWATRKLALSLASHKADRTAWEEAMTLVGNEPGRNDLQDDLIVRSAVLAQGPRPEDVRKAVSILEGMLAETPDRVDLHDQVGRLLLTLGEPEKARAHAARSAEGDNANPDAILFYANVLIALKDIPAAEAQLTRLIKIQPNGLPVAELRARVMAAKGQGEEGGKLLEKAYDEYMSSPEGLTVGERIIQILVSLKQPDAAERVANKVAEVAPRGRCLLAELLVYRGKNDDAADQLEKVAKGGDPRTAGATALALAAQPSADPRWVELADRFRSDAEKGNPGAAPAQGLESLAALRHLQHNYKEEVATYRKILEQKPKSFLFMNNMAWTLCEDLHEPAEALKVINKALEKSGKLAHILDTRGVIYTRLEKYDDAAADLEAAARDMPDDPSVRYHLARVYLKMNKPDQLRKNREIALKRGLTRDRLQESERAEWDAVMNP